MIAVRGLNSGGLPLAVLRMPRAVDKLKIIFTLLIVNTLVYRDD